MGAVLTAFGLVGLFVSVGEHRQDRLYDRLLGTGDRGTAQIQAQAMHLWAEGQHDPRELESYFVAGGVLRAVAVRTPTGGGWTS